MSKVKNKPVIFLSYSTFDSLENKIAFYYEQGYVISGEMQMREDKKENDGNYNNTFVKSSTKYYSYVQRMVYVEPTPKPSKTTVKD